MSVRIEQAIAARQCRECRNEIEIGEAHLRFYGEGLCIDDICWYCLSEKLTEIKELNKERVE